MEKQAQEDTRPTKLSAKWEHTNDRSHSGPTVVISQDMSNAFGMYDQNGNWLFFDPNVGSAKTDAASINFPKPIWGFRDAAFSEDGNTLFMIPEEGQGYSPRFTSYDVRSGRLLHTISAPNWKTFTKIVLLNSNEIACEVSNFGEDPAVLVYETATGKQSRRLSVSHVDVASLAAHVFATAVNDYKSHSVVLKLYHDQPVELIRKLAVSDSEFGGDRGNTSLLLSRDGRYLAVFNHYNPISPVATNHRMLIFDTGSGQLAGTIILGTLNVEAASFSPDATKLVIAGPNDSISGNTSYRSRLGIYVYDWKRDQVVAYVDRELSWGSFSRAFMLPSGDVIAQFEEEITSYGRN